MAAGDQRVAWQAEACPSWCVVEHRADDHPHDRKHVSAQRPVPVRALREPEPGWTGPRDVASLVEFVVCLHRRDGSGRTWVYLGDGVDQRVEIAVDDAADVVEVLRRALSDAGG